MREQWKRYRLTVLILVLALAVGSMIGSAAAKYIYSTQLTAKVTFTAELAEKIELLEHRAESTAADDKPTSNYKLTDETVVANEYELMPGVDIPKDPFVRITNKSPIPAYLYIEVVDQTNSAIGFDIDTDCWEKLESVTGPNGGGIWVYYGKNGEKLLTNENCPAAVSILKNNKITVSDTLLAADSETVATNPDSSNDVLSIWAYLYEAYKTGDSYASPKTVFTYPTT